MSIQDETIRLILDLKQSGASPETIKHVENFRDNLKKVASGGDDASKSMMHMNQRILELGRATQDFAQGGFAGILNNIERIVGGSGPLAGILTAVGVAAYVAWPHVRDLYKAFADGSNEIPKAKEGVDRLTETLKANNDVLDEMRKRQMLTNTELKEFNKLTAENVKLEKDLKQAKKEATEEEKLVALRPSGAVDREKERADILQGEMGGHQDELTAGVEQGINKAYQAQQRVFANMPEGDPRRVLALQKLQRLNKFRFGKDTARGIVRRGVIEGKETDINQMLEFLPMMPGFPGQQFRGGLETSLRGDRDAPEDEEFQRQLDERSAAVKRRNINREKRKERDKLDAEADARRSEESRDEAEASNKDLQRDIQESRKIGEALKAKKDAQGPQAIDIEKLRPLQDPRGAQSQFELNQILQENQAITASNEMIIARQNINARQIQQQLQQVPNVLAGQQ